MTTGAVACSATVAVSCLAAHSSLATGRETIVLECGECDRRLMALSFPVRAGRETGVLITGALRLTLRWHAPCQLVAPVIFVARRHVAMGQKIRVFKRRKLNLAHVARDLVQLLDAIEDLEELREKVRLAEATRVLH